MSCASARRNGVHEGNERRGPGGGGGLKATGREMTADTIGFLVAMLPCGFDELQQMLV